MLADDSASAFAAYCDAVADKVFPITFSLRHPIKSFTSDITTRTFGALDITELFASAGAVGRRPREFLVPSAPQVFVLTVVRHGLVRRNMFGRTFEFPKGCMSISDSRCAFESDQLETTSSLNVRIPGSLLRSALGIPEDYCGYPIAVNSGFNAIFRDFLFSVWTEKDRLSFSDKTDISTKIVEYLATICRRLPRQPPLCRGSSRSIVLENAIRFIESNLSDPTLNVERVAQALRISRGRLYTAARDNKPPLGQLILSTRLERCRQSLEDPGLADRRILEIAFDWGFNEAAHFSRVFKSRYGVSPFRYRRQFFSQAGFTPVKVQRN